ncbi:hypothetical protein RZS08_32095, partial [Arthrospira platensis SPKY1]|nr:hypothetical protein [Arthrospira platensis SPKY1]
MGGGGRCGVDRFRRQVGVSGGFAHQHLAAQGVRQRLGDAHIDHLADQARAVRAAVEVDNAVALGAT